MWFNVILPVFIFLPLLTPKDGLNVCLSEHRIKKTDVRHYKIPSEQPQPPVFWLDISIANDFPPTKRASSKGN